MRRILSLLMASACLTASLPAQVSRTPNLSDLSRAAASRPTGDWLLSPPPPAYSSAAPPGAPQDASDDMLFVGSSIMGPADPAWLFDVVRDQELWAGSQGATDAVNGAAYAHGGVEIFLSTAGSMNRGDLTSLPPTWSAVYSPLGSGPFDVQADDARQLLYMLAHPQPTATSELLALDNDPQSATYMQVVASTTTLSSNLFVERFGLSASGRRAAVVSSMARYLHVVDTDPASATYMDVLYQGSIPHNGPFPVVSDAVVTSDDTQVLISIQRGGGATSAIARFDLSTMSWIDHNSTTAGVQHIGPYSNPKAALGAAAFDIDIATDDSFAVVCGWNNVGWAGRVDLDPAVPSTWSWTAYSPPSGLTDAWALDLESGDDLVAIETKDEVLVLRAQTGEEVRKFPVSLSSNVYLVRMR